MYSLIHFFEKHISLIYSKTKTELLYFQTVDYLHEIISLMKII